MAIDNSNVKIENGKVMFSDEVLEYFNGLRTEKNSEWIDKYFEVLSEPSNFNALKFNIHHIRPCSTFKDKEHKNRKQTKSLADEFNENLIKLSIYNHIKAHYFLWKIFDTWDSRHAVHQMCELKKNIDELSENELSEIAKFKEECAKKNKTREEILKSYKDYKKEHKDEIKQYKEKYNRENKDKKLKWNATYRKKHAKEIAKHKKENKERFNKQTKEYSSQKCYDPKENNICTLLALQKRKRKQIEKYKDVVPKDCIFKTKEEYLLKEKELYNEEKERNEFIKKYGKNQCYDPKEQNICTLRTLQKRKQKYHEKYKDIIPRECIIKTEEEYLQKQKEYEEHLLEMKKSRKEYLSEYGKNYYRNNKMKCSENNKKNYEKNKDKYKEINKRYVETHKEEIAEYKRKFNSQLCFDPIKENYCKLETLYSRKHADKTLYKDIIPKNCIIKNQLLN